MMRFFKLGVYDPRYLERFYNQRPHLAGQSYAQQHAALIDDRAASSDFWSRALRDRGWATCDTIANARPLQEQWAREQKLSGVRSFVHDITRAQIRSFRPDVLLVADYSTFDAAFVAQVREDCRSIRIVAGWCGGPLPRQSVLRAWDLVLSCIPEMVERFSADGLDAHHLHHGFEPRILEQLAPRSTTPQAFTFAGSIVKREHFHEDRERLLTHLVKETPLEIRADIAAPPSPARPNLVRAAARYARAAMRRVASSRRMPAGVGEPMQPALSAGVIDPAIRASSRPAVFGLTMFQTLRDSAVTFNSHIDVSPRSASNMRLFEATGVGTCLLTDWKENLPELFVPDQEVVTYRTAEEAVEKFRYLADHPREREEIASAGQRRTVRDHNFDRRAERIDQLLRSALHGR